MRQRVKIATTADGSNTLCNTDLNEHYHSVYGAITESSAVFIRNGYRNCNFNPVKIFEIGFGTGLNVLLTLKENLQDNRQVIYDSVDVFPLDDKITGMLNYTPNDQYLTKFFRVIHSAEWNREIQLTDTFRLRKIEADMVKYTPERQYNLIYFDAFGPCKQPELWGEDIFRKIAGATVPGGILVTYSSKGEVKRILKKCGFIVQLLSGPPHKRQVTRAIKY